MAAVQVRVQVSTSNRVEIRSNARQTVHVTQLPGNNFRRHALEIDEDRNLSMKCDRAFVCLHGYHLEFWKGSFT